MTGILGIKSYITDNVDLMFRSIYTDNYGNKSTPGTYTVIVRAVDDTPGNIKDKTYNFIVIDDIVPVFNGPESILNRSHPQ